MASRKLERMGLEQLIVERLAMRGIVTARDLLEVSPFAVMIYLNISLLEANNIALQVSSRISMNKNQTGYLTSQ